MTGARSQPSPITVEVENVQMSFGGHEVLRDITLTADSSKRLGIIGESGSGKSTLARLIVGLLAPRSGAVTVNGGSWHSVRRRDPERRQVQMIQQDPYAQLTSHLSARAAVSEAARVCRGLKRKEAESVADEILASVSLSAELGRRRPRRLSGGQCQRVAIARALASNAKLLVADEPTSALDISVQAQIINLLLEITADRQRGLVLVSHDLAVVRHLTDEIIVLDQGRIVERGSTAQVLANPRHEYTQRVCAELAA